MARAVAESQAPHDRNTPDPTNAWTAAIAGLGLLDAANPGPERVAYLWPGCVAIWNAWQRVQTQWRVGMGGATGLDYAGVRAWLAECGPDDRTERREWFECLQACERATLDVWAEQREREQAAPGGGPPVPARM